MALRGQGSHHGGDPLLAEIARHQTTRFVEGSRLDFEQIGSALCTHHPIHPGIVILAQGKKIERDGVKVILVLHTGAQVFLSNPGWFTHSSTRLLLSVLAWLFDIRPHLQCFSRPHV
jgi:hypothetical protein